MGRAETDPRQSEAAPAAGSDAAASPRRSVRQLDLPVSERAFFQALEQLKLRMVNDYPAVNGAMNPIALSLAGLSTTGLTHVLVQYSMFSRRIVALLLDAFYVMEFEGWAEVSAEILLNTTEELGADSESRGTPHYVLLRRGYQHTLGIDLASCAESPATLQFLDAMNATLGGCDAATVAGAVYALESTATPELVMTYGWTDQLFLRMGTPVPDEVRHFFESHINEIEAEHERRLGEACAAHIDRPERFARFDRGFQSVLAEMDTWWSGLHAESLLEA